MSVQHTTLLDGRVTLHQTQDGLKASMDSVLLAASVIIKPNETILDMGCGTGAVGLCVNDRHSNLQLNGIDIQPHLIDLAQQNAIENGLNNANYVCGDVADKHVFSAESFEHIVMNPPYYKDGTRQQSPDESRETAYSGDLEIWMASALYWVRQGGGVSIIHRADALNDILYYAQKKFGAIEVWPIHSKGHEPAIRVIVKMIRNRKTPLTLHPPVILFDDDGQPSAQSNAILRDGESLT